MKNILALTDFSENAAHAAKSAVTLCGKLNANLVLYYNDISIPEIPYYTGTVWPTEDYGVLADESKRQLHKLGETLIPIIDRLDPSERKPRIDMQFGEGNLSNNIAKLVKKMNVELIVMGSSQDNFFDHLMFGSDTRSVIENATCPVLIVPPKADLHLGHIIFATDFEPEDLEPIKYLIKIGKQVNSHLDIIHVNVYGTNWSADDRQEAVFKERVSKLSYPLLTCKSVAGKDVIHRLDNLCREDNAGLLAMVHHQEPFFKRLFNQSSVKKALAGHCLPLMIFPRSANNKKDIYENA